MATTTNKPLSMATYKQFLRTGMYFTSPTVLEGDPLSKTKHDAAVAGFEAELTLLRAQVVTNEQNLALQLEFEPLRNNYWLNNNGYDQFYPPIV